MKVLLMIALLGLFGCGSDHTDKRGRTTITKTSEIDKLKERITILELLSSELIEINSRPAFADCNLVTNSLEKAICNIAQAATAEQISIIKNQLGALGKHLQEALFGEDCLDSDPLPCPSASSIKGRLGKAEIDIATNAGDISTNAGAITVLQGDVTNLESRVNVLEDRLDDFGGPGVSIEDVIDSLDSLVGDLRDTLDDLVDRVSDLEDTISDNISNPNSLITVELCADIADVGPVYEAVHLTRDYKKAYTYIRVASETGLGLVANADNAAPPSKVDLTTNIASKLCRAIIVWEAGPVLNVCWDSTSRAQNHATIKTKYNDNDSDITCAH